MQLVNNGLGLAERLALTMIPMTLTAHAAWDAFIHQRIVWSAIFVVIFVSVATAGAPVRYRDPPQD